MSAQDCLQVVDKTLREHNLFYGHGTDNPADEAAWLLEALMTRIPAARPEEINEARAAAIREVLERRVAERLPLAYLLQEAWFAGLPFYVDQRVLVPRSPIAELIDNRFEPMLAGEPRRILDLCCGGGCIGIACALAFPEASVDLADLSEQALEVAAINVRDYELEARVNLIQSDLFESLPGKYDLIVSNPPYVSEEEHAELPEEYLREPRLGLVSEDQGLAIPLRILREAAAHLEPDGLLILETGNSWRALEEAMPRAPFLWLEFERGGHGVCALSAEQLKTAPD